jgi:hypothetical protein
MLFQLSQPFINLSQLSLVLTLAGTSSLQFRTESPDEFDLCKEQEPSKGWSITLWAAMILNHGGSHMPGHRQHDNSYQ